VPVEPNGLVGSLAASAEEMRAAVNSARSELAPDNLSVDEDALRLAVRKAQRHRPRRHAPA
jgi:hypothetical protein